MPGVHRVIALALVLTPALAHADEVQADLGLAVVGLGYEHQLPNHIAVQAEAFITSTYFLDWFGINDRVDGFGAGVRLTWLQRPGASGVYGTVLGRWSGVSTAHSDTFLMQEYGLAAGYAFALPHKLELRLGLGVVGFHGSSTDSDMGTTKAVSVDGPFVQGDILLSYKL